MDQSLALFQKRDDLDELEGFQQQELSKVKHMVLTRGHAALLDDQSFRGGLDRSLLISVVFQLLRKEEQLQQKEAELRSAQRNLSELQGNLQVLKGRHEESCSLNAELEIER